MSHNIQGIFKKIVCFIKQRIRAIIRVIVLIEHRMIFIFILIMGEDNFIRILKKIAFFLNSHKRIRAIIKVIAQIEPILILILILIMFVLVLPIILILECKMIPIIQISVFLMFLINVILSKIMYIRYRPLILYVIQNHNRIMERFQMVLILIFTGFFLVFLRKSVVQLKMERDLLGDWFVKINLATPQFWPFWFSNRLRWLVCCNFLATFIRSWRKNKWASFESWHSPEIFIQTFPGCRNREILLFVFAGFYKSWQFVVPFLETYWVRMVLDFRTSGLLRFPKGSGDVILFGIARILLNFAGLLVFSWNPGSGCNLIDKINGIVYLIRYELTGCRVIQFPMKDILFIIVKKTQDGDLLYLKTGEHGTLALTPVNSGGNLVQKGEELSRFLNVEVKVVDSNSTQESN